MGSTPAPTPAPSSTPTPTNATLTDLKYSQSFSNDAAYLKGTWDKTTGTAIDGQAEAGSLNIDYDAKTSSYTVSSASRSLSFASADISSQDLDETVYKKTSGSQTDYLTLVSRPYSGGNAKQYVGMGYWQHNMTEGSNQSVEFASFTYGLPTQAAAVPRNGTAAYGIDVFGLVSMPGEEPLSFQGAGQFSVDFLQGIFDAQAYVTEYGLVTDFSAMGGGIEFRAGGSLSAIDGSFSGNAVYGSWNGQSSGSIAGRFFGPNGEELGATFATGNDYGMAAVGSLVGSKDASLKPVNQTLTAMTQEQLFYYTGEGVNGSLRWLNSETFDINMPSSDMVGGRFTINDKIASADPNFTAYAKSGDNGYGEQQVTLELYKPGAANSEVQMTYASFGHWTGTYGGPVSDYYFTYGFKTGDNYLAARTGKASYEGIAYGTGVNADASAKYDVTGNSAFSVDFSRQAFTGTLALKGTEQVTKALADFGVFNIDGALIARNSILEGGIDRDGYYGGSFWGQFYGHNAEELAGTFWVLTRAGQGDPLEVGIRGATVAKAR
ncbi:transferrin-binding protein-like solute binding protein [Novosphingobium malaysiense]|uniref:transferrin-binding protein-like solute binding protein n=1 Tax=Novosphingobium malaysiense TaxID=1348853 RepID=UPI001E2DAA89|nr:transferrin-binding protein-like solute binding protein [Novosphingobium malaysiense]